ncbi:hypothetical protein [Erysipelothrix aquatica]|uniref:hypothetical protein n=1 Tax=Erysipelothrix aquatica TaxID=2683714 RepID=UPI00135C667C|nr:hypothetical protein [Erysipelothrix aquatica]
MKQYLKKYHIALFGFTVIMSVVMSFLLGLVSSFKDYEIVGNQVVEIKGNNLIMFLSIGIPFLLVQRAAGMIFSSSLQPKMQAYLLSVGMKKEDMYHAAEVYLKKLALALIPTTCLGFLLFYNVPIQQRLFSGVVVIVLSTLLVFMSIPYFMFGIKDGTKSEDDKSPFEKILQAGAVVILFFGYEVLNNLGKFLKLTDAQRHIMIPLIYGAIILAITVKLAIRGKVSKDAFVRMDVD